MKKIIFLLLILPFISLSLSCGRSNTAEWQSDPDARIHVYFFHTSERCPACTAVEENTKAVLEANFKAVTADGTIDYQSFDLGMKENRAVAEKYQISYTSLLIIRSDGTLTDFTNNAMNYANTSPDKFMEMLKTEIGKNLE